LRILVTDFIEREILGRLTPETIALGFWTFITDDCPCLKLNVIEYYLAVRTHLVDRFFTYSLTNLLLPSYTAVRFAEASDRFYRSEKFRADMAATRQPAVLVNGLPSVEEDATTVSAPSSTSNPTATISPQRGVAKMNMLRRMRAPPLQHAWTFYHDKHSDNGNYEGRLTILQENIITIKSFWEGQNNFPIEKLKMKDSVHFFKRGVKPVWEDPRNVKGGAWTFRVPKEKSDATWKEILLFGVGENFADVIQPKDDLCGFSLSVRFNSNLIMIWNRDGKAEKTINGIRDVILAELSPELKPRDGSYYYKQHCEHSGFSEVVAKAAEAVLVSGEIKEAKVGEHEVERELLREEEEEAEAAERSRNRSQTVG